MAKNITISILCPSGHRRKAQMTPNSNLLQVRNVCKNVERENCRKWKEVAGETFLTLTHRSPPTPSFLFSTFLPTGILSFRPK
jgi:hypothetical protein